ncbi:ABC transporter substrate-binding protein [Plantactinospora sp. DSM 117369]
MTTITRRRLLGGVASLAGVSLLPACGDDDSGTESSNKLTIWTFSTNQKQHLEAFAAAHPDLDVDIVSYSLDDLHERLLVALTGGTGLPDVTQLVLRRSDEFFRTRQFLDLTDTLGPLEKDFPPGYLLGFNGKIHAFLMGPGNMGLWVNREALARHGIDVDALDTWSAMAEAGRALKQATGGKKYLFLQPGGVDGFNYFNGFYHSRGGRWIAEDGTVVADAALVADTLDYFAQRRKEEIAYRGYWAEPSFFDAVKAETVVGFGANFSVGSLTLPKNVPDQAGKWRLLTWPKWAADAPVQTGGFGGSLYAGLARTRNPDGVRQFVKWWLTPEGLRAQQQALGLIGYKPTAQLLEPEQPNPYFGQKIGSELAAVTLPPFSYADWAAVTKTVQYALDQTLLGKWTPQQAASESLAELRRR